MTGSPAPGYPLARVFWLHYVLAGALLWTVSVAVFNALAPAAALDVMFAVWPASPVTLRAALMIALALVQVLFFSVVYVQLCQAHTCWPLARMAALIIATGHGLALAVALGSVWPLAGLFYV